MLFRQFYFGSYIQPYYEAVSSLIPKIQMLIDDLFNHVFVFGYDLVKNRYKVVCLITKSEELENTFFVFKLRDPKKQWRNIKCGI